jgi:hypothetical protein
MLTIEHIERLTNDLIERYEGSSDPDLNKIYMAARLLQIALPVVEAAQADFGHMYPHHSSDDVEGALNGWADGCESLADKASASAWAKAIGL